MICRVVGSRAAGSMSTDDRIIVRTRASPPDSPGIYFSDLFLHVQSPDIRKNIVNYIENFGDLYHGCVKKDIWVSKFHEVKTEQLDLMMSEGHDIEARLDIGFKLMLTHDLISIQDWNFPSIMEIRNQHLRWINGHSRLLASGMNWIEPWHRMRCIIFVPKGNGIPADCFEEIEKITDDFMLRKILNPNISDDSPCIIDARFTPVDDDIRFQILRFEYCTKTDDRDAEKLFDRWQQWKHKYHEHGISVDVYTDWPDMISDSLRTWNMVLSGASEKNLVYHANMSVKIYIEKIHNETPSSTFRLYQFVPEKIDLAELFFWLDTDHSVYHTRDWSVVFVQPGPYKSKEISLSRL